MRAFIFSAADAGRARMKDRAMKEVVNFMDKVYEV
jgi:hypothetical protein